MTTPERPLMMVLGTRPEAIKMAPVDHALRARFGDDALHLCVTGQHRELLRQALDAFALTPDSDLALMRPGRDLARLTAAALTALRTVIVRVRPRLLLVHGDTATTLAAAMAGFYAGVPVAHVEAGLRSGDLATPFPEEFNRRTVATIAAWHYAPTEAARDALLREGVEARRILVTGNTAVDALHRTVDRLDHDTALRDRAEAALAAQLPFDRSAARIVLVTGHRRENLGVGFAQVGLALRQLAGHYPETQFVYPLHRNPKVRMAFADVLGDLPNMWLIDPLDHAPFVLLMRQAHLILTDSGGIQEEAPSLGKPVLVLRDVTERREAIAAGTVILTGTDTGRIVAATRRLLDDPAAYAAMARVENPYGDGRAAARIVEHVAGLGVV